MAHFEIKNLSFSYPTAKEKESLHDVSLTIHKGEYVVLCGKSGSGKTTLLRCLNFLETPQGGTISVNGETLFDASSKAVAKDDEIRKKRLHFGLVFQQFNLFPQYSVHRNITLSPSLKAKENGYYGKTKQQALDEIDKNADDLLKRVGLLDKRDSYPCELSGGQQQRVAIARALAMSPDILCFDEPTSALDPELTGEVLKVIRGLKSKDSTMIVVTHEMEFARNVSDKVIFMADGVIEQMGTPAQVFDDPKSEKTRAFLNKSFEVV